MRTVSFIDLQGVNIRTIVAGKGDKAIVFVHGNSCSAEMWDPQLDDVRVSANYQLISFDLPGHGGSSRIDNYRLRNIARLLSDFLENLGLKDYILVGLSFGTCVIAEAAPYLKGCKGFFLAAPNILNGENPPASWIIPFDEAPAIVSASIDDQMLTGFAKKMVVEASSPVVNEYKKSYMQTDGAFRAAIGTAIAESDWSDEFANLLNTGLPTCCVFGEQEKLIRINYLDDYPGLWRDKVYVIPGAAHLVNIEQVELFNSLLLEFAGETLS